MAYDEFGNYSGYDEEPVVAPVAPDSQAPNSYDPFGNPVYSETEEERRKREEEERKRAEKEAQRADQSVAHEHKVTTYENGSKTVETKQEIPAGQRVAGPVAPGQTTAINRAPMDANQAYTAQMESGGRSDIGYHQPGKGTAYGTYGITAPAYADIQKANPKFAGRPITDLSPEEQGEAFQTLQGINQQQLSRQGIEPTPANARLAHFLGANGAANFLKTGQISPQAAAANGGLQKALQIAQQRLAGTMGPGYGDRAKNMLARGLNAIIPSAQAGEVPRQEAGAGRGNYAGMPQAQPGEGTAVATGYGVQGTQEVPAPVNPEAQNEQAQQTQPNEPESKYSLATGRGEPGLRYGGQTAGTPGGGEGGYTPVQQGVRAYQDAQDNPQALMKLGSSDDPTVPDFIKDRARNRAADLINDQRETRKAQEALKDMPPTEMAKYLASKKTDETSTRIRGMLYAVFGNKEMAQRELDKLPGNAKDTYTVGADGKTPYLLQQNSRGEYTGGYNAETGAKLSDKELAQAAAGVTGGKWQTSAEFFQDKKGNIYQTQHNDKGQTRVVDVKTTERYTGEAPLERLRDTSALAKMEKGQEYRRENINSGVMAALQKKRGTDVMGALSDFESQSPTPLSNDDRMAFIRQYGGLGVPGTSGQAAPGGVPAGATPGFAPPGTNAPQGGGLRPVAPTSNAPAQVNAPAVPQQGGPAVTQNPAQGAGSELPASPMAGQPGYDASGKPVPLMGEGAKAFQTRLKDWQEDQQANKEIEKTGKTAIIKESSEIIANAPKFMDKIDTINKAVKLTGEKNNLGRIAQGTLPGEQTVGAFLGTKDAVNTKKIMEAVQIMAAEGMKTLGANPTDADRDYLTKNIPDENWSAEETRKWLEERRDFILRKVDVAKKQIKTGGNYMPEMPTTAPSGNTTKTINGVTYVFDGKGWKKQ